MAHFYASQTYVDASLHLDDGLPRLEPVYLRFASNSGQAKATLISNDMVWSIGTGTAVSSKKRHHPKRQQC